MPSKPLPDRSLLPLHSFHTVKLHPKPGLIAFTEVCSMYRLPPGCPDRVRIIVGKWHPESYHHDFVVDDPTSDVHGQTFNTAHWNIDSGSQLFFPGRLDLGTWTDRTPEGQSLWGWFLSHKIATAQSTAEVEALRHRYEWKVTRKWKD
jgi:hypothetical protein